MTWIQYAGASLLSRWDTPLILLALLMIVIGVGYGMAMLAASRRDPPGPRDSRNPPPAPIRFPARRTRPDHRRPRGSDRPNDPEPCCHGSLRPAPRGKCRRRLTDPAAGPSWPPGIS